MLLRTLASLILVLHVCGASAQHRLSIMNDRFSFMFPDSARIEARGHDIMGPDYDANEETRVVYDEGSSKLVVFARQLYNFGNAQMIAGIRRELDSSNYQFKKLKEDTRTAVYLLTPIQKLESNGGILERILLIKTADQLLSQVYFFLNPAGDSLIAHFNPIMDGIISSLVMGKRTLDLKPRTETLELYSHRKLIVPLKQNQYISKRPGVDFLVFSIQEIQANDTAASPLISIYVGDHPSLFKDQMDTPLAEIASSKSEFLGRSRDWINSKSSAGTPFFLREQIIDMPEWNNELKFHIAMIAGDPRVMENLTRQIISFTVKSPNK